MRVRFATSRARLVVIGAITVVVLLILGGAALAYFVPKLSVAPAQPVAFNHKVMVQAGINCLFCHTAAQRSSAPGMPSVEKCMGCHKTIATTIPVIQQVAAYYTRGEPIPWARVYQLPRFVYFSHQVHVSAGINCERCHGDVGQMTVAQKAVTMDMGWCLSCHEQQSNKLQLMDCVTCHQ